MKNKINKELRSKATLLGLFMKRAGKKTFALQQMLTGFLVRPTKGLHCSNVWITRDDGTKMRMRVYKSLNPVANSTAILWFHGGGYAMGVPEYSSTRVKHLIDASSAVVVVPDYRLSLEKPYPAAIDDAYLALVWLKQNAASLGSNSSQIFVGGESAGGGLALSLSLLARDRGEVNIAFVMPIYPMLDDRMQTKSSQNEDAPMWNAVNNREAWKLYLGELYDTKDVPCYAAPSRAQSLANMPPAVTFLGSVDIFLDETVAFFNRLEQSGTKAVCRIYEGGFHGFDIVAPNSELAKKAIEVFTEDFLYAVKHHFKENTDADAN